MWALRRDMSCSLGGGTARHKTETRKAAANAVRLQLHALAYNFGNFLRTLATPELIEDWSLTTLKDKLRIPGAAAQTRLVSMAGIRLGSWKSARARLA